LFASFHPESGTLINPLALVLQKDIKYRNAIQLAAFLLSKPQLPTIET